MAPPTGDSESPAPIDRPILGFLQTRLQATRQVFRATVTDASGHLELRVVFAPSYYPAAVDEAQLTVRWYTNDDFKLHYRKVHSEHTWECRWDRHPNPHNTRDHFHPPPTAPTPGDDDSWPTDHRDVLRLVLNEVEDRIAALGSEWTIAPAVAFIAPTKGELGAIGTTTRAVVVSSLVSAERGHR